MQEGLVVAGMLAGGLGLFMLAVSMITDGLKSAAGHSLRNMLAKSTRSPVHGVFTGLGITAIVQSSSAVTVATIGFVNAGLIPMRQALGIIYGSNIGTTMTGWLVAIIGFELNVDAFALPMIGVGMLLRLTGGDSKRAPLGLALVGFGLFFIGIDVLKNAFDGLLVAVDLNAFTIQGGWAVPMFVGIGFLITLLTQSSSAAIAIILTAASGGVVGLYAAAAMVVGANVGTTSTAVIAVIGATSNAKRVACAHILFNGGTGLVALLILPILFWIVENTGQFFGLDSAPAVTLALFHTIFNILGVILMFPMNNRLANFLEKRFVTQEEIEARPQYLDKTVAVSPILALNALTRELSRVTAVARRMALAALSHEHAHDQNIRHDHAVVLQLSKTVFDFIARLEREKLSKDVAEALSKILRAAQHLLASADQSLEIAKHKTSMYNVVDNLSVSGVTHYRAQVGSLIAMADPDSEGFAIADMELQLDAVQSAYDDTKASLLLAGAEQRLPINTMMDIIDQNSHIRRMARQIFKAVQLLSVLDLATGVKTSEPEDQTRSELQQAPQANLQETAAAAGVTEEQ